MPRSDSKTNRTSPQKDSQQKLPSKEGNRNGPSNNHFSEATMVAHRSALSSLMPKGDQFGEVVRLAYSTEADEVVIDEDGLYLLQKYSTDTIGFLGFMSQDELSKNFFLDAGLNLCGCQGNQFTNVYGQQQTEGIYLWSLPLIPNPKLKIFLLVCSGLPPASQQLHRRHQILLDLTLLLSSSLAILNTPHIFANKNKRIFEQDNFQQFKGFDALPFMLKDFGAANQRIHKQCSILSRDDSFWPQTASFLQPFRFSASVERQSQELFSRCHYYEMGSPLLHKEQTVQELLLSLNEQVPRADPSFLEQVGQLWLSLIGSCTVKEYEGLKMTGNLVCKLLINSVKYMAKKLVIKLDKIFTSIFKELYQASYIYHCQNYQQLLEQIFTEEEPMSQDALLLALQSTADTVLASFNQQASNPQSQLYELKLLQYIQEKERLIIDVNMRKNEHQIAVKIKQIQQQTPFEAQYIRKYIDSLKTIVVEHDHSSIQLIVEKLLKYSNNLEQRIIDQKLKMEREQITDLKEQLREKYMQYMKSKGVNEEVRRENQSQEAAYKKSLKELRSFQTSVKNFKKEIDAERRFQKEYMITKQSKKEAAEKLLEEIRQVEEKVRDNNRQMEDINKEYDYHPDILALNKRLEDREKQIRLLEKNESRLYSNIHHSLVRSAIQKQPEVISQVQKSAIRQVSQREAESTVPERKAIKRLTTSKK